MDALEIEHSMMVEASTSRAFQAFDSAKAQLAWVASLIEVSVEPEPPWGKGAHFTQIHLESGMRQEFKGQILEYEKNRRVVVQLEHNDLTLINEVTLQDLGERTQIDQCTKIVLHSVALKIVKGMVKGAIERRIGEDFERLKTLLESNV